LVRLSDVSRLGLANACVSGDEMDGKVPVPPRPSVRFFLFLFRSISGLGRVALSSEVGYGDRGYGDTASSGVLRGRVTGELGNGAKRTASFFVAGCNFGDLGSSKSVMRGEA